MTTLQKIIKYGAIAFGIYLSVTIIFIFLSIARSLVRNSNDEFNDIIEYSEEEYNTTDISTTYENIKALEVDLETISLTIKRGETFTLEGTNVPDKVEIRQDGGTLKIDDEMISSDISDEDAMLTIYIPETQILDRVNLDLKYVSVDLETLNATNIKLDMENTNCVIEILTTDNLEINNEYGDMDIRNAETKRLTFDSEIGTEDISIRVTKSAKIDLENSDTNIDLKGTQEEYQVIYKKQYGSLNIAGTEMTSNNETFSNGNIKINIDAENTNLDIDFEEITQSNL